MKTFNITSDLLKQEHGGWWLPGDPLAGLPGRARVRLALVARFSMANGDWWATARKPRRDQDNAERLNISW